MLSFERNIQDSEGCFHPAFLDAFPGGELFFQVDVALERRGEGDAIARRSVGLAEIGLLFARIGQQRFDGRQMAFGFCCAC